jgi:DHA1 family bicyclomycin/chloramphenicol resistance-like MFS transporter
MLAAAVTVAALAGLVLLAAAYLRVGGLLGIVVPLFFYVSMIGLTGANAVAGALSYFPQLAGTASALFGAVQFGLGAVAGAAVGAWYEKDAVPMAAVIATVGVLALGAQYWLTKD